MALASGNAEDVIMRLQTTAVDALITVDLQPDQRQSQRHQLSQPAIVNVIEAADQIFQGEIRNVSKGGTQLRIDRPLATGSLLKIEYANNLLLGEVIYCIPEQTGWVVGLRAEHALFGLTALADALRGAW